MWSPPLPLHAPALNPLSREGAALAHLDSLPPYDLMLWTDGSVSVPFGKGGSGVLANCSLCGTEATLFFQQTQYTQVFPLKPAPFCMLFAGFCSINMSAISLLFFYLTLALFWPSCPLFLLPQFLWQKLSSLSACCIKLQWIPGHSFLPGNEAADELTGRSAILVPSAIPCSLSPLISCINSCLFSDWRRIVLSKFFEKQVSSIFTEELVLPRHARCVFSRLRCNGHSLQLSSYLSRISRTENPSWSACGHSSQDTSHLILHCPATDSLRRSLFGDSLSLCDLWSRPWEVARLLGFHGLPPCPHPKEGAG